MIVSERKSLRIETAQKDLPLNHTERSLWFNAQGIVTAKCARLGESGSYSGSPTRNQREYAFVSLVPQEQRTPQVEEELLRQLARELNEELTQRFEIISITLVTQTEGREELYKNQLSFTE